MNAITEANALGFLDKLATKIVSNSHKLDNLQLRHACEAWQVAGQCVVKWREMVGTQAEGLAERQARDAIGEVQSIVWQIV